MDSSILEENWTGALRLEIHPNSVRLSGRVTDNRHLMKFRWLVLIVRFSSVDLWGLAVLFILAIHGSTSVW